MLRRVLLKSVLDSSGALSRSLTGRLSVSLLPPDGMLLHRKIISISSSFPEKLPVPTCAPGWGRGNVWVKYLPQNTAYSPGQFSNQRTSHHATAFLTARSVLYCLYIWGNNVNEQITRVSFAENECIFHVTRVQITKSARCQNFVCLDFLRCVFHVIY